MPTTTITVKKTQATKFDRVGMEETSLFVSSKYGANDCIKILREYEQMIQGILEEEHLTSFNLIVLNISQIPEDITEEILENGWLGIECIDYFKELTQLRKARI